MFPLSQMSLSTPVNTSEAARSRIICGMEPRADAPSDTRTELKMIVALVLGGPHFSQHYLAWLNDRGGDKGDGLNAEERRG